MQDEAQTGLLDETAMRCVESQRTFILAKHAVCWVYQCLVGGWNCMYLIYALFEYVITSITSL